jgi:hypothetical protein
MSDDELNDRLLRSRKNCPVCNSEHLQPIDARHGHVIRLRIQCRDCHVSWTEEFQFIIASDFRDGDVK